METPEAIIPSREAIDKNELLAALEARIHELRDVIRNKVLSETCMDFAIPE